jgi:probable rRNA maturation factor
MLRRAATLSGLAERADRAAELHVVLVDALAITTLNEVHLGHEGPTDVIAFDLGEEVPVPGEPQVAGEIYVCLDVAVQMGTELGTGAAHELVLYCVHGMLHLAGLDDHEPTDRKRMRAAEARIMAELREIRDLQDIL